MPDRFPAGKDDVDLGGAIEFYGFRGQLISKDIEPVVLPSCAETAMGVARSYFGDSIHPITKPAVIVEALRSAGISMAAALRGVGISEADFQSPAAKISIDDTVRIYQNALASVRDPFFAYKAGLKLHLVAYGLYGFAVLSSRNFRQTCKFVINYHDLADPLVTLSFEETAHHGIWSIEPLDHPAIEGPLYRFVVEFQLGIHTALHRDVMGAEFKAAGANLRYAEPPHAAQYRCEVGSAVKFSQARNQLLFDRNWLDQIPQFGNDRSYVLTSNMCDDLLSEMKVTRGTGGRVRQALMANLGRNMNADAVARRLQITSRTLRRHLREENLSFREILDDLREKMAQRYLLGSLMSIEEIAAALGFSDAANFRHAFKHWTGQSPQQFRAGKRAPISDRSSLIPSLGSKAGDQGASVQAIEP